MTKDEIKTDLSDLQGWEGIIGRKLRFKGLTNYDTDRPIFGLNFEICYFRHDNPELDISAFFKPEIKTLIATDLNFVDSEGNDVHRQVIPAVLDEEGNMVTPETLGDYPEGSINEHDFWIYGVLSGEIVFWNVIYQAMMKRVGEGYFD